MISAWKWGLAGAFVGCLVLAGWVANGWRLRALDAANYQRELRHELERRIFADAKRLAKEREVDALKAALAQKVTTVKETVVRYVKENPDCDLPEPAASQLQRLRQGRDVPTTPAKPADPG